MMENQDAETLPWYRQFWPWYIIGLLFVGVFGTSILVVSAIDHPDPIVVDNYYKEGLAINRTLDRQRKAKTMGLLAQAQYDSTNGILSIRLSARHAITAPALQLFFVHATLANRDYSVKLTRKDMDVYQAQVKTLLPGNYDLMLEPEDKLWRLDAHLTMPAQSWKFIPEL